MPDSQIKVDVVDYMGSDLTVVNAARVSFDKESEWETLILTNDEYEERMDQLDEEGWKGIDTFYEPYHGHEFRRLKEKDKKLIHYLAKHVHLSPFGHCFASFRVKAPIFVARQLVKHKFLRWNEVSRRYVDSEPEFYVPDVWRGKADDKKQGSSGEHPSFNHGKGTGYREEEYEHNQDCLQFYERLIEIGVCPEQARMVLPQSMMTSWWWSGSMDAFANMCKLRCKEDTQYETRLVANQVDDIMSHLYPESWTALRAYAE